MTANELADYIELHKYNSNYKHIQEAITMLRQQQAEIEALKAKTLTDEEILELTNDSNIFEYREFNDDMVRFARAILKKASEK
jgi:hypothetical protein